MEEIKKWLNETGITNLGWLGGFIVGLAIGWPIIAGFCLGIFACHNYVVIRNIIKTRIEK
jgi:hypothetical protein